MFHQSTGVMKAMPMMMLAHIRGFRSRWRSAGEKMTKATMRPGKASIICLLNVPKPMVRASAAQRQRQVGFSTASQNSSNARDQNSSSGASMVKNRFKPMFAGVSRISRAAT